VRRTAWCQRGWSRALPAIALLVLAGCLPDRVLAQEGAAPADTTQTQTEPSSPQPQPSHTTTVPAQAGHATYVGQAKCAECHEEVMDTWEHNPHHGAQVDRHEAGSTVQCESCHGPGSLHAEADGDESHPGFATIRVFKRMSPAAQAAVCRSCHTMGEQFHWDQSSHARNDIACQSCHSMHAPKSQGGKALLSHSRPTELCLSCHEDKRAEIARSAHMPLREGGMDCSSCHNPHGSPAPNMIRKTSNHELCTTCHMDKRGPFLWEHPPVREDCVTCHMPHGSNNEKVLTSKKPFLCQRCHIATRHPSTLYDRPDLVSNRLFNRSCTNCHSQIHGSNHPSGKTFLR
jgi:DmsE family decaheme c-type cytochrome